MTLETTKAIYLLSSAFCIGACLVMIMNRLADIILKRPGATKSQRQEKTKMRVDNFIVCACADCVHHSVPAHNLQCSIDRTYITSDGKCISYVPRPTSGEE